MLNLYYKTVEQNWTFYKRFHLFCGISGNKFVWTKLIWHHRPWHFSQHNTPIPQSISCRTNGCSYRRGLQLQSSRASILQLFDAYLLQQNWITRLLTHRDTLSLFDLTQSGMSATLSPGVSFIKLANAPNGAWKLCTSFSTQKLWSIKKTSRENMRSLTQTPKGIFLLKEV